MRNSPSRRIGKFINKDLFERQRHHVEVLRLRGGQAVRDLGGVAVHDQRVQVALTALVQDVEPLGQLRLVRQGDEHLDDVGLQFRERVLEQDLAAVHDAHVVAHVP